MRGLSLFVVLTSLLVAVEATGAEVDYKHPNVTLIAKNEPLESILALLSKEMRITVTSPAGINRVVDCDIQNESVNAAFKKLLGDLSYSLVWADNGERLTGLIILSDGESSAVAATRTISSPPNDAVSAAAESGPETSPHIHARGSEIPRSTEHEAKEANEREKWEARMAEEREALELKIAQQQREEEIAHEAKKREEIAHQEAEAEAWLNSNGVQLKR